MNILLPIDGSKYTKRMLAYVAAHDEWLGARHQDTVVHVVPKIPPHAASFLAREAGDAYYADESEKVFRPIRTFFGKQVCRRSSLACRGMPARRSQGWPTAARSICS